MNQEIEFGDYVFMRFKSGDRSWQDDVFMYLGQRGSRIMLANLSKHKHIRELRLFRSDEITLEKASPEEVWMTF